MDRNPEHVDSESTEETGPVLIPLHEQRQNIMEKTMPLIRKELARLSRESLLANIPRKIISKKEILKMPDEVAIELSMQHIRAFLGMDRPNVFTSTK